MAQDHFENSVRILTVAAELSQPLLNTIILIP